MPSSATAVPTRERLIHTAHNLFYRDGFHNVGLDRIIDVVGVTKTTFYNHFESKDDLVLEVLRHHDRWWRDTFAAILRQHGGDLPRGQLLAVPAAIEEVLTSADYNGCIFINVAVAFPLPHDPAHQAAADHLRAMQSLLRELAAYAGAADPLALAQEICMVMEGSYVMQHVDRATPALEIARRLIRTIVDRHLPEAHSSARKTAPLATARKQA